MFVYSLLAAIRATRYTAKKVILENEDPAAVAWKAIEPILNDLPYSSASKLDAFMTDLTEGQKALISIDWRQKEIRNGGFEQLFENSTGNLVPFAIPGFRLIGAKRYADLLAKAVDMLGNDYPKSSAARKRLLRSLNQIELRKLKALDNEFLDLIYSAEHDLEKYRGGYVKRNPSQFVSS